MEPLIYLHVVNPESNENRLMIFKGNTASGASRAPSSPRPPVLGAWEEADPHLQGGPILGPRPHPTAGGCRPSSPSAVRPAFPPKHKKSFGTCLSACLPHSLSPQGEVGASICPESHTWVGTLFFTQVYYTRSFPGFLHAAILPRPPLSISLSPSVCRTITQKPLSLAVSSKSKWDFLVGIRIRESPAFRTAQQYVKHGGHFHRQGSEHSVCINSVNPPVTPCKETVLSSLPEMRKRRRRF